MEYTNVRYREANGSEENRKIQKVAVKCPFCRIQMIPNYLYSCGNKKSGVGVFCRCTNPDCEKPFISEYVLNSNMYTYSRILPNFDVDKKDFGHIIYEISPTFCNIYNQALLLNK